MTEDYSKEFLEKHPRFIEKPIAAQTVLLSGSQGFIGSYIAQELLNAGYFVFGVDNFSKYGIVERPHDGHKMFRLLKADLIKDFETIRFMVCETLKPDYIIHAAARIGGISYFHKYASDLLRDNTRIDSNVFDLAIWLKQNTDNFQKIVAMSSSMVFENTKKYPTPEEEVGVCPPPSSTYGFSKLAMEYQAKGAWEQYKVPFTIIRPFNCVGVGEEKALGAEETTAGNAKLMLSHVLPDLINKALQLKPTDTLPILGQGNQVRHYTNGKDIARGIRMAMESEKALNNDFNISHPTPYTVKELASEVWRQIHGTELKLECLDPFEYDVQVRSPDVSKATKVLGFTAEIGLEESVAEVIKWMKR